MTAVSGVLAIGVVRLVLRAGAVGLGLSDGSGTAGDVLDRLADLTGEALGLPAARKQDTPVARIAGAIEQRMAARVAGMPASTLRSDLKGVALDVGGLFTRLADDDSAIVAALEADSAADFASWVASHGGRTVRLYAAQGAQSLTDDCVRIACDTFFEVRAVLPGFARASLVTLLQRTRDIPALIDTVDHLAAVLDELAAAARRRNADASYEELEEYLTKRLVDWDALTWRTQERAPSLIERRLLVTDSSDHPEPMRADEALAGCSVLAVLGGPGSGKTWLARRYARTAAQCAIEQLRSGAGLDQIELPILTTWGTWQKLTGPTDTTLIDASFDARMGVSALSARGVRDRLQRTLGRAKRVLAVVDSLDEAASDAENVGRLISLLALPDGWRAVVTSRHGAWNEVTGPSAAGAHPRVVELAALSYRDDVVPFIRSWFPDNPARADALAQQIGSRRDLRDNATVPLLLTFYCLLASDDQAGASLPSRRRALYDQIARRLLLGPWSGQPHPGDLEACLDLLGRWAWDAVKDANAPSGLGTWIDGFEQPGPRPAGQIGRALDNVAPVTHTDDVGRVYRAFRHRTILEHFVAEHIATLPTRRAFEALLPHLWFDIDWRTVAAAAAAAHNHHTNGALLRSLQRLPERWPDGSERRAARDEFQLFLLRIAAESDPQDWDSAERAVLDNARERAASSGLHLELLVRSRNWLDSSEAVVAAVCIALTAAPDSAAAGGLAHALVDLATTENTRHHATTAILTTLATGPSPSAVRELTRTLVALDPTEDDRHQAITAVLNALSTAPGPFAVLDLARTLVTLDPTEDDRHQAISAVLNATTTGPSLFTHDDLVRALVGLATTDDTRHQATTAILTTFSTDADAFAVDDLARTLVALARTLVALDPTEDDRHQAITAVRTALTTDPNPSAVGDLARALVALNPTEDDRRQATRALCTAVTTETDSFGVSDLVWALVDVATTEDTRHQAITAVRTALTIDPDALAVDVMTRALVALATTEDTCHQAITAVRAAFAGKHNHIAVHALARALVAVATTEDTRHQAIAAVRTALTIGDPAPSAVADLAQALVALNPTEDDRHQAIAAVRTALATGPNPSAVGDLARALVALDPTEDTCHQAITAVRTALTTDPNPSAVGDLARALVALDPTEDTRRQAITAVRTALTCDPDLFASDNLVRLLIDLTTPENARQQATSAIRCTSTTDPDPFAVHELTRALVVLAAIEASDNEVIAAVDDLAWALVGLDTTENARLEAIAAVLTALTGNQARSAVGELVRPLVALATTENARHQATTAIRAALTGNPDPHVAGALARALADVATAPEDRPEAARTLLRLVAKQPELAGELRRVSTLAEWLRWLEGRPQTKGCARRTPESEERDPPGCTRKRPTVA